MLSNDPVSINYLVAEVFVGLLVFLVAAAIWAYLTRDKQPPHPGWLAVVLVLLVFGFVAFILLVDAMQPKPRVEPTPTASAFVSVLLKKYAQAQVPVTNALGLSPGKQNLLDIPFETGWEVTTQNRDFPDYRTSIPLDLKVSNPVSVYLLMQGGWGYKQYQGKQIGSVSLRFADGSTSEVRLVLGDNIRDWARNNPLAVSTATSPMLRQGYPGTVTQPGGIIGGIDILTIDIPQEERGGTLTGITLDDTTQATTGSLDPAIHLLAVTVKHQP
jgi:hypothetical protein